MPYFDIATTQKLTDASKNSSSKRWGASSNWFPAKANAG